MTYHVHHCVQGRIRSADTQLLDTVESALPSADDVRLGSEMNVQRIENDDGTATLSARMTFQRGEIDLDDGTTTDGATEAAKLYDAVKNHDLASRADGWTLRHYRTPEGAVTTADVRAWYEAHPSEQPTDDEGEPYIPTQWDPLRHCISETTG